MGDASGTFQNVNAIGNQALQNAVCDASGTLWACSKCYWQVVVLTM